MSEEDIITVFDVNPDPTTLEETLQETTISKEGKVNFLALFKYSNWIDILLVILGTIGSIGCGIIQPLMMLIIGDMINCYTENVPSGLTTAEEINRGLFTAFVTHYNKALISMVYFGIGNMICGVMKSFYFFVVSQRQSITVRSLFFKSLLRQDATWYDQQDIGEITSKMLVDIKNFLGLS